MKYTDWQHAIESQGFQVRRIEVHGDDAHRVSVYDAQGEYLAQAIVLAWRDGGVSVYWDQASNTIEADVALLNRRTA